MLAPYHWRLRLRCHDELRQFIALLAPLGKRGVESARAPEVNIAKKTKEKRKKNKKRKKKG